MAYTGQQADGLTTRAQLESLRAEVSGPNGRLTGVMKGMKDVPKEDRPAFGKRINEAKQAVQAIFDGILETVEASEIAAELGPAVDPSLSSPDFGPGSLHPLTQIREEICRIFKQIGFTVAEEEQRVKRVLLLPMPSIRQNHPTKISGLPLYLQDDIAFGNVSKKIDEQMLLRHPFCANPYHARARPLR